MSQKRVYSLKEAQTGELHGGAGTFRVLIDKDMGGAKHLSFLVNTSKAGATGKPHKHDVEHVWYVLSGSGTIFFEDDEEGQRMEPNCAVYTPANTIHHHRVDPAQDMTYIVVYAPPGPEQQLKAKGTQAFEDTK